MKGLDWYIARRYLSSRRKGRFLSLITVIAIAGVGLGVGALITVIAVMTGLQTELREKILGNNPHVYVFEPGQSFRLERYKPLLEPVRNVPGVVAVQPFVMTQVGLVKENGAYAQAGVLYGIAPDVEGEPLTVVQERIRSGEYAFGPTQTGLPGILVGRRLAEKMNLLPGDVVTVISGENIKTGPLGDLQPAIRQFEVTGRFDTGMYDYDSQNLYAPMSAVQELLDLPENTVSGLAVNVVDPWNADEVGRAIQEALGVPYYAQSWVELNATLFSALKLEKLALFVILSLIILVAAFNIVSTLVMVVKDKTKEIGILKSMGLTDARVLRVFMLQGLAIGMVGTAIGAVGGLVLVWLLDRYKFITLPGDVYFVDTLPVALDAVDLLLIVGVSILIALLATIHPARQASRLQPVEAIRHE
ncbi:MAG TPA: ABC transporter permease [Longimicrobiales bacterium]